eukprot:3262704-Pyramimonas_sp.AAC.1
MALVKAMVRKRVRVCVDINASATYGCEKDFGARAWRFASVARVLSCSGRTLDQHGCPAL